MRELSWVDSAVLIWSQAEELVSKPHLLVLASKNSAFRADINSRQTFELSEIHIQISITSDPRYHLFIISIFILARMMSWIL